MPDAQAVGRAVEPMPIRPGTRTVVGSDAISACRLLEDGAWELKIVCQSQALANARQASTRPRWSRQRASSRTLRSPCSAGTLCSLVLICILVPALAEGSE